MYSEKVLEHFRNPRNQGKIDNPDGVGYVGNEICGDTMKVYIKVEDDIVKDIKFETLGCAAAIASSSAFTEIVKNKTIEDALKITQNDVVKELGGLPEQKIHCSLLAQEAFEEAVEDYTRKKCV
ncbi:MAG: iron-sulfur cluster assembly scaffold protein [bacterium]